MGTNPTCPALSLLTWWDSVGGTKQGSAEAKTEKRKAGGIIRQCPPGIHEVLNKLARPCNLSTQEVEPGGSGI